MGLFYSLVTPFLIFYHNNDFLPPLVSFYLVNTAEFFFFFLPQNGFSKHFAVLKNDFITPKSRLMIHNAKVPYHRLPLINPSKPQFFLSIIDQDLLICFDIGGKYFPNQIFLKWDQEHRKHSLPFHLNFIFNSTFQK